MHLLNARNLLKQYELYDWLTTRSSLTFSSLNMISYTFIVWQSAIMIKLFFSIFFLKSLRHARTNHFLINY